MQEAPGGGVRPVPHHCHRFRVFWCYWRVLRVGGGGFCGFLAFTFLRRLRRGGKDEQRCRQMALLEFEKGRTRMGDRQTAHVGLSNFRLTRVGKCFWGLGPYVVEVKGKKWGKGLNWRWVVRSV
jgi:hypothetical protein